MDQRKEAVFRYIDEHRQEILEDWKALVNHEGSLRQPDAMHAEAEYLCGRFREAGVDCAVHSASPEIPPVVAGEIGTGRPGKPVIFAGHFDTVFNPGTFGENPFRIEGDKAYGPGVLDMKGGIIIALWTIKALEAAGYDERPIRVCFCSDEEGGDFHDPAIAQFRRWGEGCCAGFNMETAPVDNSLCVGRKYLMAGKAVIHGVSAHSGNNYLAGRNAILEAAYKVIGIQALNDLEKGTHMNPAIVRGGTVMNAIPDSCELDFSGRFPTLAEVERVKEGLAKLFGESTIEGTHSEYTLSAARGGLEVTEEGKRLRRFVDSVSQENGWPAVGEVVLGGGSDAGYIAEMGVPILCSCGVRGEWNHTDREYALVESMFERPKLWAAVVLAMNGFSAE